MFNVQGSEIIVIALLALVVLGPEKLPDAIRRFTKTYSELKRMGTGFQTELKSAIDEPMREMRETAQLVRDAADPSKIATEAEAEQRLATEAAERQAEIAEREAEAAAESMAKDETAEARRRRVEAAGRSERQRKARLEAKAQESAAADDSEGDATTEPGVDASNESDLLDDDVATPGDAPEAELTSDDKAIAEAES